jgi:hypothetical protein
MHAAVRGAFALVCLAPLFAQQTPAPVMYTYVTEWTFPRAQWDNVDAFYEKSVRAVMDRHLRDGGIVEWGRAVPLVHTDKGATHVNWFAGPTVAGVFRALDDLRKLPRNEALLSGTHTDQLLRSALYKGSKDMPRRSVYMMTSNVNVMPGKGTEWRALWDKNADPVYSELMKDGTILGYGIDQELVHTSSPSARFEWVLLPTIEAVDKMNEAFQKRARARTADENRAMGAAMREVGDSATHRDGLYYVVDYAHK